MPNNMSSSESLKASWPLITTMHQSAYAAVYRNSRTVTLLSPSEYGAPLLYSQLLKHALGGSRGCML